MSWQNQILLVTLVLSLPYILAKRETGVTPKVLQIVPGLKDPPLEPLKDSKVWCNILSVIISDLERPVSQI